MLSTRPSERQAAPAPRRSRRTRVNAVVVVLSVVLAVLLLGHTAVPDVLGLGLLIDSTVPWLGLLIPVLVIAGASTRRGRPWIAALVPAVIWCVLFVPAMIPLAWSAPAPSDSTLTVASQNVEADSGTGVESALALAATGADVVALQEMDNSTRAQIADAMESQYDYSYQVGTVGLWSDYPIVNAQPQRLGLGWDRALAADLETPSGAVSIYVVHAASARLDDHAERDTMLAELADTIPKDENERILVVGDLNAASTDRALGALQGELTEANQTDGGFGFTWPSFLPGTRLDHLFTKGVVVTSNETLRTGGSDHLAILAQLNL
jgi:vancomycin resistance protein VanJ